VKLLLNENKGRQKGDATHIFPVKNRGKRKRQIGPERRSSGGGGRGSRWQSGKRKELDFHTKGTLVKGSRGRAATPPLKGGGWMTKNIEHVNNEGKKQRERSKKVTRRSCVGLDAKNDQETNTGEGKKRKKSR